MNTGEKRREQISALADGELDEGDIEAVFSSLHHGESKEDWELYHQIGDILRSKDMAINLSPNFAERLSARLDQEPTIIAPSTMLPSERLSEKKNPARNWALPGLAAAAVVVVAVLANMPHLLQEGAKERETLASSQPAEAAQATISSASDSVVLRDPRIDDYVLAHQRFSPSVYSTAQYARSATFDADSSK